MAAIGSTAQRSSSTHPARGNAVFRRRLVVGALCVLSLALVTVYFRESDNGFLHSVQSTGASVLKPFEVAADRIASPFEDAASWFGGILHAKSDNKELRKELDRLREQAILNQSALRENAQLKQLLRYLESPRFPNDYRPVTTRVIARPPGTRISHRLTAGEGGMKLLVYGTRVANDMAYYPHSKKIFFRGLGVIVNAEHVPYG